MAANDSAAVTDHTPELLTLPLSQTGQFQYKDFVTSTLTDQRSFFVMLTSWIATMSQGERKPSESRVKRVVFTNKADGFFFSITQVL